MTRACGQVLQWWTNSSVLLEATVPAKKPGLTVDEHKALGTELHSMRDRLMQLYVESTHKYPVNSAVARHLAGSFARVDQARSALDDCLAKEHPAEFDPMIYYPGGGPTASNSGCR